MTELHQYSIETDSDKFWGYRDDDGNLWLEGVDIEEDDSEVVDTNGLWDEIQKKLRIFILFNDTSQFGRCDDCECGKCKKPKRKIIRVKVSNQ